MDLALLGKAVAMFAVTNIDDMMVLAVFFGKGARDRRHVIRVVIGQYIGFVAILAVSVLGALGAGLLPEKAIPYLGLLPVFLGLRAAWQVWRSRHAARDMTDDAEAYENTRMLEVAAVTFANGGDNIGVYIPVFAVAGTGGMIGYVAIFLVGVAVWCAAGWYFASRKPVAQLLSRWGHLALPVVLIAIGLVILIEGGVFSL